MIFICVMQETLLKEKYGVKSIQLLIARSAHFKPIKMKVDILDLMMLKNNFQCFTVRAMCNEWREWHNMS